MRAYCDYAEYCFKGVHPSAAHEAPLSAARAGHWHAAVARCATAAGGSCTPEIASLATLSAKQEQNVSMAAGEAPLLAMSFARQVLFTSVAKASCVG